MKTSSGLYYVSAQKGNDKNDGSAHHPFATLFEVKSLNLKPGEQVLLERGYVFPGQFLHLSVQGTKKAQI